MISTSSRVLCYKTGSGGKVCLFLHVSQACFSSVLRNSVNSPVKSSSLDQLCPTLCVPMNYSTLGFPNMINSQILLKLMFIKLVMPSNHLILCHPLFCLQSFPVSGSFKMSQFFASGGQSIGVSASASVLPMNIQERFPLGLTYLISLQYKGLSRVFFSTTVQKHQFFGAQLTCCFLAEISQRCT